MVHLPPQVQMSARGGRRHGRLYTTIHSGIKRAFALSCSVCLDTLSNICGRMSERWRHKPLFHCTQPSKF